MRGVRGSERGIGTNTAVNAAADAGTRLSDGTSGK